MELPRQRPLGGQGRNPTHDFLSLYNHPTLQPDPVSPPSQGGGILKTHDFLQPLERGEKEAATEGLPRLENTVVIKQQSAAAPAVKSVEHMLPGGIGTYSISHISYYKHRAWKNETASILPPTRGGSAERNEENSNCSSYSGSGFTLWEESACAVNKWNGEKDAASESFDYVREKASKPSEWTPSNSHRNSLGSPSPSHQPSSCPTTQGFMEMIKGVKTDSQDDDLDEEELVLKRESLSPVQKGDLSVIVERKSYDQKASTPRSKHSATEQRRRSKINDRFRMLREIIPQGDQKRDKASFLLEVIEYIQFLQVKVQKYEGSYGWTSDQSKLCSWRNNITSPSAVDLSQNKNSDLNPAFFFPEKVDQKIAGSDMKPAAIFKQTDQQHNSNKSFPYPLSLQPSVYLSRASDALHSHPGFGYELQKSTIQPKPPIQAHKNSCSLGERAALDKLKEQDLNIQGGTINISNLYSQGLLNTLTQALQNSGVDLSQASLSVQIDVGKRASGRQGTATAAPLKESLTCLEEKARQRPSACVDSEHVLKKLKTGKR